MGLWWHKAKTQPAALLPQQSPQHAGSATSELPNNRVWALTHPLGTSQLALSRGMSKARQGKEGAGKPGGSGRDKHTPPSLASDTSRDAGAAAAALWGHPTLTGKSFPPTPHLTLPSDRVKLFPLVPPLCVLVQNPTKSWDSSWREKTHRIHQHFARQQVPLSLPIPTLRRWRSFWR